jgi:ribosomal protein L3 glutamine methyltransferase
MTVSNETEIFAATTVSELIEAIADGMEGTDLCYGHGTDNAVDEAAALVFHVCKLDHAFAVAGYTRKVSDAERDRVVQLLIERMETRKPLPYLLGEAWFAGMRFSVDERVLVPRSPLAELILDRFEPWLDPARINRVLEIGTGSGCIAIACAANFHDAEVVATDISAEALQVAAENVRQHGLRDRVSLVETDHAEGVNGRFDLILSNPPYVPEAEGSELPAEYGFEPALGLYSGGDGLDSARRILQDAPLLLNEQGALVLEVGAQWQALERAFPAMSFTWLVFQSGGEGVALISRQDIENGL